MKNRLNLLAKGRKRALSLALAVMMVVALLPVAGITPAAQAAGPVHIVVGHTGGVATVFNVNPALNAAGITRDGNTPFSVTFASGVTTIGDWAFRGASSLTSVTIPDSVTTIGESAFMTAHALTSVTIGNSVTSIGDSAFEGTPIVTLNINMPTIPSGHFGTVWLRNLTIGNSVTSIGMNAFSGASIETLNINMPTIPGGHFGRSTLRNLTIGNSVRTIGRDAFWRASSEQ